jgi:hypothetical protein
VSKVLHQLRFDLLRLWPWLVVWGVLLAVQVALAAWQGDAVFSPIGIYAPETYSLQLLFLFFFLPVLLQSESPLGSSGFWLSRPLPGGAVLAAKMLFLVLLGIAAGVAAFTALQIHGVSPSLSLKAAGAGLAALFTALPFLLFATFTANFFKYLGVFLLSFLVGLAVLVATGPMIPPGVSAGALPFLTAAEWLSSGLLLASLLHLYLWRRIGRSLMLVGVALLVQAGCLVAPWLGSGRIEARNPSPFTLAPVRLEAWPAIEPIAGSKPDQLALVATLLVRGRPPGLLAVPEAVDGRLQAGDESQRFAGSVRAVGERQEWSFTVEGDHLALPDIQQSLRVQLSEFSTLYFRRHRGETARYRGRLALRLMQLRVTGRTPLRTGGAFATAAGASRITAVARRPGGWIVRLREPELSASFLPRESTAGVYAFYNPRLRQGFLAPWDPYESGFSTKAPWSFQVIERRISLPNLDAAWLAGAELLRVEPVDLGPATAEVTIDPLTLPEPAT